MAAIITPAVARVAIGERIRLWRLTVLRGTVELAARECGVSAAAMEALEGGAADVLLDDYLKVVARVGRLERLAQASVPDEVLLERIAEIAAG